MRAPWHILQNGYCMFRPVLKFIFRIAAWLSGMLAFALLTISLYHRFQIFQESSLIERPIGQLVEVDGKRLNVYTTGMGDRTLVFLSGLGTNAPTLDFKALYSRLENDYRVVVVERLGYGYSDDGTMTDRWINSLARPARLSRQLKFPAPMSWCRIPWQDWRLSTGQIVIQKKWKPLSVWTCPFRQLEYRISDSIRFRG